MHWSVTSAKQLDDYRLELTFQDGKSGVVDFAKYVRQGGVFARLADRKLFQQWRINPDFGTIGWSDDLDIAPETLYQQATAATQPARACPASGSPSATSSGPSGIAEARAPYGRRRGRTRSAQTASEGLTTDYADDTDDFDRSEPSFVVGTSPFSVSSVTFCCRAARCPSVPSVSSVVTIRSLFLQPNSRID